jgi:anti-sigma B factor antagonist
MSEGSLVETQECDGIVEAKLLCSRILDEPTIQVIGSQLVAAIADRKDPQMILDFSEVEHLSSSALGMLISLNNRIREAGGGLCLAAIDSRILDVFRITKLDRLLDIFESTADARNAARG